MDVEAEKKLLKENMKAWLIHFGERARRAEADLQQLLETGFGEADRLVTQARHVATVKRRESDDYERAVEDRAAPGSRKGWLDDWRQLAQGRIPRPHGRGRPKDLEATLRAEAAEGIGVFFDCDEPEDFEVWMAWLGVLRMWHYLNPGKAEPFIADQVGWIREAEEQARAERRSSQGGDPSLSGTKKTPRVVELLLDRLDRESSSKHLGQ